MVKCAMQISKEPSAAIELEGLDLRKIEEADFLSVGVYGSSLVAKRNTAINI